MARWILAAGLLLIGACGKGGPQQARQAAPIPVRVQPLQAESVERVVELTGTLAGWEEVTVSAEVDGKVETIAADLGDAVAAGASLIRLAPAELRYRKEEAESDYHQSLARLGIDEGGLDRFDPATQAEVRRAWADLEEAKRNRARGEELLRRELLAQGELDTLRTRERVAEAAYQRALEEARSNLALAKGKRAALRLAAKKLADTNIRSPIRGVVARRLVSLGEFVRAGQAVAVVVMSDPLKLQGEVPERYVGMLEAKMPVEVELSSKPGEVHTGEISRVGPLVAVSSRTFPMEARIPNEAGALRPGLFAHARIRLGTDEQVFAIPETAVSAIAGVHKVFVEKEGQAFERPVQVLRKRGSEALIRSEALAEGERVILTAIARLYDGAAVRVEAAPDDARAGKDER